MGSPALHPDTPSLAAPCHPMGAPLPPTLPGHRERPSRQHTTPRRTRHRAKDRGYGPTDGSRGARLGHTSRRHLGLWKPPVRPRDHAQTALMVTRCQAPPRARKAARLPPPGRAGEPLRPGTPTPSAPRRRGPRTPGRPGPQPLHTGPTSPPAPVRRLSREKRTQLRTSPALAQPPAARAPHPAARQPRRLRSQRPAEGTRQGQPGPRAPAHPERGEDVPGQAAAGSGAGRPLPGTAGSARGVRTTGPGPEPLRHGRPARRVGLRAPLNRGPRPRTGSGAGAARRGAASGRAEPNRTARRDRCRPAPLGPTRSPWARSSKDASSSASPSASRSASP